MQGGKHLPRAASMHESRRTHDGTFWNKALKSRRNNSDALQTESPGWRCFEYQEVQPPATPVQPSGQWCCGGGAGPRGRGQAVKARHPRVHLDFLRAPGANTKSRKEELKGLERGWVEGAPLVSSLAKTKPN